MSDSPKRFECPLCRRVFKTLLAKGDVLRHQESGACRADALALRLFAEGKVPFPEGHSLPPFIETEVHYTRASYNLRTSTISVYAEQEPQHWAPRWVRIVTELYRIRGERRPAGSPRGGRFWDPLQEERDALLGVLLGVLLDDAETCRAIEAVFDIGYGAAVDTFLTAYQERIKEERRL